MAEARPTPRHPLSRRLLALAVVCALAAWLVPVATASGAAPKRGPSALTLVDTLGAAGTTGRIAQSGSNGYELAFDQSVGLLFKVTRPTVLLEVGGFVQDPWSFGAAADVNVEIHPARASGVPDRDLVIASSPLSRRSVPGFVVYQRARFLTLLRPGTYYALFATRDQTGPATSNALLVSSGPLRTARGASIPFTAPTAVGGVTHPDSYDPSVREVRVPVQVAARVLGIGLPPKWDDWLRLIRGLTAAHYPPR